MPCLNVGLHEAGDVLVTSFGRNAQIVWAVRARWRMCERAWFSCELCVFASLSPSVCVCESVCVWLCFCLECVHVCLKRRSLQAAHASRANQIGLLAAGQSSTMTGTYAGQFVMSGFWNLDIAMWKVLRGVRRVTCVRVDDTAIARSARSLRVQLRSSRPLYLLSWRAASSTKWTSG